ncbi:hypothetical protein [Glutamicibacter nicotianae]|uniref:hypothetical protein n=1 Tax=Glutamicibacter nicotianae TaxID=37929 RepID=UPI00195693E0
MATSNASACATPAPAAGLDSAIIRPPKSYSTAHDPSACSIISSSFRKLGPAETMCLASSWAISSACCRA